LQEASIPRWTLVAALVVAVVSTTSAALASPSSRVTTDPLVGTWDTAPIPVAKIRTALKARGYTTVAIDKMFKSYKFLYHIKNSIQYEIRFYREVDQTPFQIRTFWDPSTGPKPLNGDHGPYKLLPGHRFSWVGTTPPTDTYRTTFRYAVDGKTLRLTFLGLVEPGLSAAQLLADKKIPILQALAPYKKVD
jgi:hypothetical protein